MPTKFFKAMTQPIAGMTLFALIGLSWSFVAVAQLPTLDPEQLQQAPLNHSTQLQTADILSRGDRPQDLTLRNKDAIWQQGNKVVVPKATEIPPAARIELAQAHFSPDTIRESVVGKVKAPATVQIPTNTTSNPPMLNVGGFNDSRARRTNVKLIRLNPNGRISRENISANFAQCANTRNNPILCDNDIVVVSRSNTARVADAVNLFLSPGAGIITLFSILGIT